MWFTIRHPDLIYTLSYLIHPSLPTTWKHLLTIMTPFTKMWTSLDNPLFLFIQGMQGQSMIKYLREGHLIATTLLGISHQYCSPSLNTDRTLWKGLNRLRGQEEFQRIIDINTSRMQKRDSKLMLSRSTMMDGFRKEVIRGQRALRSLVRRIMWLIPHIMELSLTLWSWRVNKAPVSVSALNSVILWYRLNRHLIHSNKEVQKLL